MIREFDLYCVSKLDQLTSWAQKKHGISLVRIHCMNMGFCFASSVLSNYDRPVTMAVFGIFWGVFLYGYIVWGNKNADYQTNWRKTQTLNFEAVVSLGAWGPRIAFWFLMAVLLLGLFFPPVTSLEIISDLQAASAMLSLYLNPCTYHVYSKQTETKSLINAAREGA